MGLSQDDCGLSNLTIAISAYFPFVSYKILLPMYLVVGLAGNVTLLIAFWKRSKTEKPYTYQVILTASKTLEIWCFGVYLFTLFNMAGFTDEGVSWYRRNFFFMVCSAHLGPALHMLFIISSLLCSVAMAADRVFALWKPFIYKDIKHNRHQIVATALCFLIPSCTVIQDIWYLEIISEGEVYKIIPNEVFIGGLLAKSFAYLRSAIRVVGVFLLVILCILMISLFRSRMLKVGQLSIPEDKDKARKEADRNLIILNVYQSILMCLNQIPHACWQIIIFMAPQMERCYATTVGPSCDAFIYLTDSIDIFIVLAINKKMREIVLSAVSPCKLCKKDGVSTTTGASGSGRVYPN